MDNHGRRTDPQLRETLRSGIEEGKYPPGTALPSESELAGRFGCERSVVHNALDALTREGLLKCVPGKGTFVLGRKVERNLDELQGFTQTMLDENVTPSSKIISRQSRKAGMKYSLMFGIRPDDEVHYIKRLCCADGEPISLEDIFIPRYVVPKLAGIDLSVFSVYEVYGMYGIKLVQARQTLDIVHLEQADVRLLGIDPSLPVLLFQCVTYDDMGRAIEFNRNFVRGDKCNFSVRFSR
ncbi:MAG: GntR family transcriptional regulator [Ruminococcaceae bacterium]|nr:GntR family transcriptional regulator [Oscillospiraceae bacterium]